MILHSILLGLGIRLASAGRSGEHRPPQQCRWDSGSRLRLGGEPSCVALVDDRTAAEIGSWEPWAYAPHCVYPPEQGSASKLCVYTYHSANGEAGLSLIATPEMASFVAGILSARSEPWGEFPSWQLSPGEARRAYEVVEVPGKGLGVVARRKIHRGEVIIRETPFVLGFTSDPGAAAGGEKPGLVEVAFTRLPEWHLERLSGMAVSTGGEWHEDVMRTNTFGVMVDGVEYSALFPEIARINHACRPNAFTRYSRTTLQMEIVAQQDIESDEEVTITYIPQNLLTADRQKLISRRGFTCGCPVCSTPSVASSSDANKSRINAILGTLRDLGPQRTEKILDELWQEMRQILAEESLHAQVAEFAGLWADLYWAAGAAAKAREIAGRVLAERVFYNGKDSERAERAKGFARKFEG
ncbi:uncharacterized protein DNG_07812 [Cephalotrichum gorgonifer]|uniref:SET domain-containing protein n=1 Tax=Cephalotrichum gorgonifer TaxID=2041049 RepID=A0AAE8N5C4_9PEZI|nr:uncharacterized protein DNG_07812 [Cephalotrichum gorgonifer]